LFNFDSGRRLRQRKNNVTPEYDRDHAIEDHRCHSITKAGIPVASAWQQSLQIRRQEFRRRICSLGAVASMHCRRTTACRVGL
jgi:hypothetical protein